MNFRLQKLEKLLDNSEKLLTVLAIALVLALLCFFLFLYHHLFNPYKGYSENFTTSATDEMSEDPYVQTRYIGTHMALYRSKNSDTPIKIIDPQAVTIIKDEGKWLLIESELGEKWINLEYIRQSVKLDVKELNQQDLKYPTGCEIVSLGMMIGYTNPMVNIEELVLKMPRSQNPNYGFRGEPIEWDGYTIFPKALLKLTDEYLGNAIDMTGCTVDDLKSKLNQDKPIVAWVSGLGFGVHAICLTGYDELGLYYNDPWTGIKDNFISYEEFTEIWEKPIKDHEIGITYSIRKALSY